MVNDYFIPIYCILPKKCVVKEIFISEWRIGDVHEYLIQMFRGAVNRKIRLLHIHSQVASYTMTRNNSILDVDNQRQSLKELAEKYTSIRRKDYLEWRIRLEHEMTKVEEK